MLCSLYLGTVPATVIVKMCCKIQTEILIHTPGFVCVFDCITLYIDK